MTPAPLLALLALAACLAAPVDEPRASAPTLRAPDAAVVTGAQRLVAERFAPLDGMRVGLVTNHTARVDTADGGPAHLIDRLHAAPNVLVGALFGPEHGIRGDAEAGAGVSGGRDGTTGAPVYSLYGSSKKPTQRQLRGLDALVFDMQDVGARFYTYISTMGYAMQAAAEAGIPFVVLDRPNPIGDRAEGFVLEPRQQSFVGLYPIPVTHGLTVGELARMIVGEGWLSGLDGLDLRVVEMTGYARGMAWEETGLAWVPPSPNVPDVETARVYPGTALFEGTTASEGRGTRVPFTHVGSPWADPEALAAELNGADLAGVRFEPATFVPVDLPGQATNPKWEGETVRGVRLVVTDPAAFRPVATGVHVVDAVYRQAPRGAHGAFLKADWLAKLAGTTRLRRMWLDGRGAAEIVAAWADEAAAFSARSEVYRIYE
ncbi:exo-beta-N-acetylmuramidase NamZ domain-containing protein [Rubrivirga sp. IMCC45206]|uniref:exo-beta-N-acetylmuramidase NamZ family protein n=1 Tax=Rubrivirga sp. IMCC45206 TaxID=3391614 RepID=UPI00398FB8F5